MVICITVALGQESAGSCSLSMEIFHYLIQRRNINIPWPIKGMGDADYLFAFQHVIMPVAFDFDPDLVMSKSKISSSSFLLTV